MLSFSFKYDILWTKEDDDNFSNIVEGYKVVEEIVGLSDKEIEFVINEDNIKEEK